MKFSDCSTHISVFKISLNLQLWSGAVADVSLDSAGCLDVLNYKWAYLQRTFFCDYDIPSHSLTFECLLSLLLKWEFVVTPCLCTCICVYVSTPREMSGPFMLPSPLSTDVVMCCLPFPLCVGWWVGGGLLFIFWLVWSKVNSGSNCRQASHRKAHQSK